MSIQKHMRFKTQVIDLTIATILITLAVIDAFTTYVAFRISCVNYKVIELNAVANYLFNVLGFENTLVLATILRIVLVTTCYIVCNICIKHGLLKEIEKFGIYTLFLLAYTLPVIANTYFITFRKNLIPDLTIAKLLANMYIVTTPYATYLATIVIVRGRKIKQLKLQYGNCLTILGSPLLG